MLRAKSPFKKRSPKLDEGDVTPAPPPPLHHYNSFHEFQELQKQQQLLNGNAWAQQKGRSRTNSQLEVDGQDTPQTSIATGVQPLDSTDPFSLSIMDVKTHKARKHVPAPLKLVPDSATRAVPTQRDGLENKRHVLMQSQMNMAGHESNTDLNSKPHTSTGADDAPSSSTEHISRPKSPGKKLFQKLFRHHTSSETPPKISPEWEETPEKAVKILGKESLKRRKDDKTSKKRESEEERLLETLEFKCAGGSAHNRSNTLASTIGSTPSTAEFSAPTDREIRSVGGIGRHAIRVPTSAVQRTVSDTATLNTISNAIDEKFARRSELSHLERQHNHLQYLNNTIPPTPPSKERTLRPPITTVPSTDVKAALGNNPDTPSTAFRVVGGGEGENPSPLPPHLARFCGNEYLNLVLNKPSYSSLRGAPSVRSAYGFIISPSAELANGSTFSSSASHFIESPAGPRSAGLPKSRDASLESKAPSPGGRTLSRRWSDTSLAAWKAQSERAVPCLPPTFYSPYGFIAPPGYSNFTRPSANDDPSLYYLPQATAGDLESFASRNCSESKLTPPTSAESSFASASVEEAGGSNIKPDEEITPLCKPHRFLVKKRCSSNIAAAARKDAVHGLGISPLLKAMDHGSDSAGSEAISFPSGPPSGPPSAMPPPLNIFRPASVQSLPAKEELDAFLSLHLHIDSGTNMIHHFIDRKFDQNIQAVTTQHDETLKTLSSSFHELLSKISGVDEQYVKVHGTLDAFKADMNDKIMSVINVLQEKVLDPMSKMIESNAQLDQSVGHLVARVVDMEKKQKDILESLSSKGVQKAEQTVTLPPIMNGQHPAPPFTNDSPHHSFSNQSFAATYPTSYGNNHPTTTGAPLYPYLPYADPFTTHTPSYPNTLSWNGHVVDAGFAKLPRDQRVQHVQSRYGGGVQMPRHPAFRNQERDGGTESNHGKDGANGA